MDNRKEIIEKYKNRKPEKGIISFKNVETGISFLGKAEDTKAEINSITFKLKSSWYPNEELVKLWKEYGEGGFEISVLEVLDYDNPNDDHSKDLDELLEKALENTLGSKRLKKLKK